MNSTAVQRSFIIGDEWSYFKIYTGFKTADSLLTDCLYPLSQNLLQNGIIDKWFFIRYSDPKFHLRVRFHTDLVQKVPAVLMHFNQAIKKYVISDQVWKVQADTYNRELERYGSETIESAETLFWHDSEMICRIISSEKVKTDENLRWLLGLKMIDRLLTDFGLSLEEKEPLLNKLQDSFKKEFGINSNDYRRQFGDKYRASKLRIEKMLHPDTESEEEFAPLFHAIGVKSGRIRETTAALKDEMVKGSKFSLDTLLPSYIHMMLNRLFRTQQRTHELILYDYLYCYYHSQKARKEKAEKPKEKNVVLEEIKV